MFYVDEEPSSLPPPRPYSFNRNRSQVPYTNAPHVDTLNAMTRHDYNNCTKPASLEFEQPCSAPSIQPWPDHARHSALIRSCPPAVAGGRDLVINHQILNNSPESSMVMPRLAISSALQFPGISFYLGTQTICTLYVFVTLFRCFRQP